MTYFIGYKGLLNLLLDCKGHMVSFRFHKCKKEDLGPSIAPCVCVKGLDQWALNPLLRNSDESLKELTHRPWSPAELFSPQPTGQPLSPGIQNLEAAANPESSHLSAGPQTMSLWTEKWWNRDILKQEAVGVRVRLPLMKSVDMITQQRVVVRIKWVYISKGLEWYLAHNIYNSQTHTCTHAHTHFPPRNTHMHTHTHFPPRNTHMHTHALFPPRGRSNQFFRVC